MTNDITVERFKFGLDTGWQVRHPQGIVQFRGQNAECLALEWAETCSYILECYESNLIPSFKIQGELCDPCECGVL